jgi:hypothetical protein
MVWHALVIRFTIKRERKKEAKREKEREREITPTTIIH